MITYLSLKPSFSSDLGESSCLREFRLILFVGVKHKVRSGRMKLEGRKLWPLLQKLISKKFVTRDI